MLRENYTIKTTLPKPVMSIVHAKCCLCYWVWWKFDMMKFWHQIYLQACQNSRYENKNPSFTVMSITHKSLRKCDRLGWIMSTSCISLINQVISISHTCQKYQLLPFLNVHRSTVHLVNKKLRNKKSHLPFSWVSCSSPCREKWFRASFISPRPTHILQI